MICTTLPSARFRTDASYCQFCGRRQRAQASLFPEAVAGVRRSTASSPASAAASRGISTPIRSSSAWPGSSCPSCPAPSCSACSPTSSPGSSCRKRSPPPSPSSSGAGACSGRPTNVTVAGVCGGLAEYFTVDVTAVRILWGPALHLPRLRDLRHLRLRAGLVHHAGRDGDSGGRAALTAARAVVGPGAGSQRGIKLRPGRGGALRPRSGSCSQRPRSPLGSPPGCPPPRSHRPDGHPERAGREPPPPAVCSTAT